MDIRGMIEDRLRADGFDGLCHNVIGCGCKVADLMPCGDPSPDCVAGHLGPPPEGSDADFWIYPGKVKESGDD